MHRENALALGLLGLIIHISSDCAGDFLREASATTKLHHHGSFSKNVAEFMHTAAVNSLQTPSHRPRMLQQGEQYPSCSACTAAR
jgi:hypothetical protein